MHVGRTCARATVLAVVFLTSCDSPTDLAPDEDARVLPSGVGLLVTESSASLDAGAIEGFSASTHSRILTSGFAVDADMQLRTAVDPRTLKRRFFTLHSSSAAVVERTATGTALTKWSLQPGANPQDLALASDGRIWVTQYGSGSVAVLGEDPASTPQMVDMAPFADADGKPDMSAVTILDETAYVALRRLTNGFQPETSSVLVAVDAKTLATRKVLDFPALNPWQEFRVRKGALWATCIGGPISRPPIEDAALVRIDVRSGVAERVLTHVELGGFVTAFDFLDDQRIVAVVASYADGNPTSVVTIDTSTRTVTSTWMRTADYKLWDVVAVANEDIVLVANRTESAPAIEVLSRTDGARLGSIRTRLLPIEIVVTREE